MRVTEIKRMIDPDGQPEEEQVRLAAAYGSDENKEWSKYTPWANLEIGINNPAAFGALGKDHEFYVDFTPANQG